MHTFACTCRYTCTSTCPWSFASWAHTWAPVWGEGRVGGARSQAPLAPPSPSYSTWSVHHMIWCTRTGPPKHPSQQAGWGFLRSCRACSRAWGGPPPLPLERAGYPAKGWEGVPLMRLVNPEAPGFHAKTPQKGATDWAPPSVAPLFGGFACLTHNPRTCPRDYG